jgi:K+-transporting ATPase A subunit
MTTNGWLQLAVYFAVVAALVVPLGRYMARVFEGERTFLSPMLRPVEVFLYRIAGAHGIVAETQTGFGPIGRSTHMLDVIMLALGLGFFALSVGYAYACERL